jgi:hypothetical protein
VGKINSKTSKIIGSGINSKTSKIISWGSKYKWVSESEKWGKLTVRLVQSLGQAIDTNELEWESRVRKINSKTSKIIKSGNRYKWVRVGVKSGKD